MHFHVFHRHTVLKGPSLLLNRQRTLKLILRKHSGRSVSHASCSPDDASLTITNKLHLVAFMEVEFVSKLDGDRDLPFLVTTPVLGIWIVAMVCSLHS